MCSPILLPESQMRPLSFWAVNHFNTLIGVLRRILTLLYGNLFVGKGRLQDPLLQRAGELLNLIRNQLGTMMDLLKGHCHVKGIVETGAR
jgi:hypothetical protein